MIVNQQRVGDALYNSKYYCNYNYGWEIFYEYIDVYTFNLYGDPSLVLQGIDVQGNPEKPTLSGEPSGKINQEYTYFAISTDPNNDDIFYWFDWDDETNSGWLGPYYSGEECSANHSWSKRGDYEIKVRAKDVNGIISDWSDPFSVTMPKIKEINISLLLQRFFHCFPQLEKILTKIT